MYLPSANRVRACTSCQKALVYTQYTPVLAFSLFAFQECEEWAKLPLELHSFPTVDALATRATEADLRAMGEEAVLAVVLFGGLDARILDCTTGTIVVE